MGELETLVYIKGNLAGDPLLIDLPLQLSSRNLGTESWPEWYSGYDLLSNKYPIVTPVKKILTRELEGRFRRPLWASWKL